MNVSVKTIIAHFNKVNNRSLRFNNIHNVRIIESCLNEDESNVSEIMDHITNNPGENLEVVLSNFNKPIKTNTNDAAVLLESFMNAASKAFTETKAQNIEDHILEIAESKLEEYISEKYGYIPKKVELTINNEVKIIDGVVHEKFDEIMDFIALDEPVFLVGPSGSGKSFIVQQIAQALNLPYYFSNAITQEYYLTGYSDASGHYIPTSFYKAWTEGGVFLLDEMDASIPEVLVKLNEALANKRFDFPAPIGNVEAHPNFRVVAAGNTYGLGADFEYVGRNQLDAASLDRFGIIKVDYDRQIELNMAQNDENLVTFFHEVRMACEKNGIQMVASYRSINRIAKLKSLRKDRPNYDLGEILTSCLFKGLGKDDIRHIYENIKSDNEYKEAMKKMAS